MFPELKERKIQKEKEVTYNERRFHRADTNTKTEQGATHNRKWVLKYKQTNTQQDRASEKSK